MKTLFSIAVAGAMLATGATVVYAQSDPMVGGAAMYPTKTIVQNAMQSKDHTTLVAAVKAAGLVKTLSGPGPYTVFAPTNAAFAKLPKSAVASLMKPANKAKLAKVLTYHVVPGRITAQDIAAKAKAHHGVASYKTVEGETLRFTKSGSGWAIMDVHGDKGMITIPNVYQSNGVIHVIDTVMMP